MIAVKNLTKKFDKYTILENINCTFESGKIYGILGTNGAGKSTLLRTITGIYKADNGTVTLDNNLIYENINCKKQIFYIPDEDVFFPKSTVNDNIELYKSFYDSFDNEVYNSLSSLFNLDCNRDIKSFSKGMKKQALLLITLSFIPKYVLLDETFDGLDPIIRVKLKKFLIELVDEKNLCLIISTHNINDIENLIDTLIIVTESKIVINDIFDDEQQKYYKAGVSFKEEIDLNQIPLNIKNITSLGAIHTIIFQNSKEDIAQILNKFDPIVLEIVPLTKEELFILEVEGL